MKNVAIIGGGIEGISAAYNLWKKGLPRQNITIFESRERLGLTRCGDIGFNLIDRKASPLLLQFFKELDAEICDTVMSISVENDFVSFATNRGNLWGIMMSFLKAPIRTLQFLWALYTFFTDARFFIKDFSNDKKKSSTINEFCTTRKYGTDFVQNFIGPFISSCLYLNGDLWDSDAFTVFTSLDNHNFLQFGCFNLVLSRYSIEGYTNAFLHKCQPIVHLKTKVNSIKHADNLKWRIDNSAIEYDKVIFAVDGPELNNIEIDTSITDSLNLITTLNEMQYDNVYIITHQDETLMPNVRSNWSINNLKNGVVTYWVNSHHLIGSTPDIFVTIDKRDQLTDNGIDENKNLLKSLAISYPIHNQHNNQIISEVRNLQGQYGLYACGASLDTSFLEDQYRNGYEVAQMISDRDVDMYESIIVCDKPFLESRSVLTYIPDTVATTVMRQVLKRIMKKGCIGLLTRDHGVEFFGESGINTVMLKINNPSLVWKCILMGDIGFAEAYIDGNMEVDNLPLLIFYLVINVYPQSQNIMRSVVFFLSKMKQRIMYAKRLKNTISSAKQNIIDHYDLGNDFFSTFLDTTMTYSSAIFRKQSDTLETAQLQKYDRLLDQLNVQEGDHVLEIGCGWGGMAERAATTRRCSMTCITLSPEQAKYCRERVARNNIQHLVKIYEIDYREVQNVFEEVKFDAVVSIEMIEAIGPDNFDNYFRTISQILKPRGKVGIQAITRFEDQYNNFKRDPDFLTEYIFPGGCLPSLGVIAQSASRSGLVMSDAYNISKSYARTLEIWRGKFNQATVDSNFKFDKMFIRIWNMYFSMSQAAFEANNVQDFQIIFEPMRSKNDTFFTSEHPM